MKQVIWALKVLKYFIIKFSHLYIRYTSLIPTSWLWVLRGLTCAGKKTLDLTFLSKLLNSSCKYVLGLKWLGTTRVECKDVVHVMAVGKSNDVISDAWLEVVTTGWCHSHGLLKVCTELRKPRDIEGYSFLKEGRSKIRVPGVKKDLDPEIKVFLEKIKFMPSPWFSRGVH